MSPHTEEIFIGLFVIISIQAALIQGTLLGVKYMNKNNGGRGGCIVNMGSAAGIQTTVLKEILYI